MQYCESSSDESELKAPLPVQFEEDIERRIPRRISISSCSTEFELAAKAARFGTGSQRTSSCGTSPDTLSDADDSPGIVEDELDGEDDCLDPTVAVVTNPGKGRRPRQSGPTKALTTEFIDVADPRLPELPTCLPPTRWGNTVGLLPQEGAVPVQKENEPATVELEPLSLLPPPCKASLFPLPIGNVAHIVENVLVVCRTLNDILGDDDDNQEHIFEEAEEDEGDRPVLDVGSTLVYLRTREELEEDRSEPEVTENDQKSQRQVNDNADNEVALIGTVATIFGPVTSCSYAIPLDAPHVAHPSRTLAKLYKRLKPGRRIFAVQEHDRVVHDPLSHAEPNATDASFVQDAELPTWAKPDFSDDEKERQFKQDRKNCKIKIEIIGEEIISSDEDEKSEYEFDAEGQIISLIRGGKRKDQSLAGAHNPVARETGKKKRPRDLTGTVSGAPTRQQHRTTQLQPPPSHQCHHYQQPHPYYQQQQLQYSAPPTHYHQPEQMWFESHQHQHHYGYHHHHHHHYQQQQPNHAQHVEQNTEPWQAPVHRQSVQHYPSSPSYYVSGPLNHTQPPTFPHYHHDHSNHHHHLHYCHHQGQHLPPPPPPPQQRSFYGQQQPSAPQSTGPKKHYVSPAAATLAAVPPPPPQY